MNHSKAGRGKGAGANILRIGGLFFVIFIVLFLSIGRKQLSQSLEQSIFFNDEKALSLSSLEIPRLDTLFNERFGFGYTDSLSQVYFSLINSCAAFTEDSTVFNQMYFVNPDWVPTGNTEYIEYFKSANLTGLNYKAVSISLKANHSNECVYTLVEVVMLNSEYSYMFSYLDSAGNKIDFENIVIRYQDF